MEEARHVLRRLERIDRLRASGAGRRVLLAEIRGLLRDGERWLAAEPDAGEGARDALADCRRRLDPDASA